MRLRSTTYAPDTSRMIVILAFIVAALVLSFYMGGTDWLMHSFIGASLLGVTATEVKTSREAAAAKFKEASEFYEKNKDKDDNLSAEQLKSFDNLMAEAKKLDETYIASASQHPGTRVEGLKERLEFYFKNATGRNLPFNDAVRTDATSRKSAGQQFVDSPEYKALRESGVLNSDSASFKSKPFVTEQKAATDLIYSGAGPGGALVTPDYLPGILPLPQKPLTIRDLFSNDTTESDVLSYARQSAFDNAAAPVAQAVSLATGAKPQSSIAWTRVTSPIESIATWMAATRRQLMDAGQTRSLIDNQLRLMLQLVEEDQLVNGNGTSPNLRGILATSGVQTYDISAAAAVKFQNIDAIRRAIRLIKTGAARMDATGVVMNPADVEILDTQKDTQSRYIGNGPFDMGPRTLWRRTIVESESVASGFALVGAFKTGATVFQREPIAIFTSDSHSDFFIKNLVAVLAEERLGLATFFPSAFCYVTFKTPWA